MVQLDMSLAYTAETLFSKDVYELDVTMVDKAAHKSYASTFGMETTKVFCTGCRLLAF
jgi:hypothetical protein